MRPSQVLLTSLMIKHKRVSQNFGDSGTVYMLSYLIVLIKVLDRFIETCG